MLCTSWYTQYRRSIGAIAALLRGRMELSPHSGGDSSTRGSGVAGGAWPASEPAHAPGLGRAGHRQGQGQGRASASGGDSLRTRLLDGVSGAGAALDMDMDMYLGWGDTGTVAGQRAAGDKRLQTASHCRSPGEWSADSLLELYAEETAPLAKAKWRTVLRKWFFMCIVPVTGLTAVGLVVVVCHHRSAKEAARQARASAARRGEPRTPHTPTPIATVVSRHVPAWAIPYMAPAYFGVLLLIGVMSHFATEVDPTWALSRHSAFEFALIVYLCITTLLCLFECAPKQMVPFDAAAAGLVAHVRHVAREAGAELPDDPRVPWLSSLDARQLCIWQPKIVQSCAADLTAALSSSAVAGLVSNRVSGGVVALTSAPGPEPIFQLLQIGSGTDNWSRLPPSLSAFVAVWASFLATAPLLGGAIEFPRGDVGYSLENQFLVVWAIVAMFWTTIGWWAAAGSSYRAKCEEVARQQGRLPPSRRDPRTPRQIVREDHRLVAYRALGMTILTIFVCIATFVLAFSYWVVDLLTMVMTVVLSMLLIVLFGRIAATTRTAWRQRGMVIATVKRPAEAPQPVQQSATVTKRKGYKALLLDAGSPVHMQYLITLCNTVAGTARAQVANFDIVVATTGLAAVILILAVAVQVFLFEVTAQDVPYFVAAGCFVTFAVLAAFAVIAVGSFTNSAFRRIPRELAALHRQASEAFLTRRLLARATLTAPLGGAEAAADRAGSGRGSSSTRGGSSGGLRARKVAGVAGAATAEEAHLEVKPVAQPPASTVAAATAAGHGAHRGVAESEPVSGPGSGPAGGAVGALYADREGLSGGATGREGGDVNEVRRRRQEQALTLLRAELSDLDRNLYQLKVFGVTLRPQLVAVLGSGLLTAGTYLLSRVGQMHLHIEA